MSRDYERISIEKFGRHLITTGDLDPIYIAASKMDWTAAQRNRFLVAYWCMYHAGVACFLSELEGMDFWAMLHRAAVNEIGPASSNYSTDERWPRGHERRHWRGMQAVASYKELMDRYGQNPEEMVEYIGMTDLPQAGPIPFAVINERAQEHRGFGPWISFKIGDMLDRLGIMPIDFTEGEIFIFKDPAKAAERLYRERAGIGENVQVKMHVVIPEIVKYLIHEFRDLKAPPINDRPIGLQEVETVLCKWKSMMNGHYRPYNDINEISDGLSPWTESSETARLFLENMPTGGDSW